MTEVYTIDLTAGAPDWPEGKPWRWHEQVCYLFPQGLALLGRLPLTKTEWRLLMTLMGHCEWGNHCPTSCAVLGREVGLSRSWVSRLLRSLALRQLLVLKSTPGQQQPTIVLSPLLCWKGRPWHLSYARRQFLAAWQLHHGDGPGSGHDHTGSVPGPRVRATASPEPPPTGSANLALPHLSPTPPPPV